MRLSLHISLPNCASMEVVPSAFNGLTGLASFMACKSNTASSCRSRRFYFGRVRSPSGAVKGCSSPPTLSASEPLVEGPPRRRMTSALPAADVSDIDRHRKCLPLSWKPWLMNGKIERPWRPAPNLDTDTDGELAAAERKTSHNGKWNGIIIMQVRISGNLLATHSLALASHVGRRDY